jgi:hypothetical protein
MLAGANAFEIWKRGWSMTAAPCSAVLPSKLTLAGKSQAAIEKIGA